MELLKEHEELLINNSLKDKKLFEGIDAEDYEKIIGNVVRDSIRTFIAYDICDIQPLTSPQGLVFARSSDVSKFEIIKKSVKVNNEKVDVEISQEALDDLNALKSTKLFENFVSSSTKNSETKKFMKFLKDNAVATTDLTLTQEAKDNIEVNLFYLTKKINDIVMEMNKDNFKTYDAYCILPYNLIGGLLGISFTYSRKQFTIDLNRPQNFFIGETNNLRFYVNIDPNETECIVGLNSKVETGVSSIIYSPYNITITSQDGAFDHNKHFHVWLRNAWTLNPMHTTAKPMLMKFKVN